MLKLRRHLLYLLLALTGFVGLALYLVLHGVLNADEGFYLAASHLVSEGYRPYHDFGYTQGPLFPYLSLVWLEVFGQTLAGQRLAGLAWTLLTLALGIGWLKRRYSYGVATLFVVLLIGAPVWLAFAVKGKTYALAGLAVLAGAVALLGRGSVAWRWTVFVVAAAVGTGARLPVAGFFAPAFVGMLILTPGWRARIVAAMTMIFAAIVVIGAAAGGEWNRFFFWTTGFHRDSSFYIPVWTHFVDCFRFAPVLWVLAGLTVWSWRASSTRRSPSEPLETSARRTGSSAYGVDRSERAPLVVLGSLGVAFVSNLSASTTYAEYIFPFFPALALVVAPLAAELFASRAQVWRSVMVMAMVAAGWNYPPEFSRDLLVHAAQAERFLRDQVPAGSVVACSMPEIAVAAGTRIPLTMAMGKFGVTEDFSAIVAAERRMMTPASLRAILIDPATKALVGSPSYNWNFFWSLPSYRVLSPAAREEIQATIRAHYRLEFMNDEYVIYLRRAQPAN